MTVEILCVGTEILLGNIVNTNAKYLAEKCAQWGLSLYYQTVVGDNEERLKEAIETALNRSDVLITSGGLGPTNDDITKEMVAEALGLDLEMDERSKQLIEEYFARNNRSFPDNNYKQALIPEGGEALENKNGTAPAIMIETDKTKAKDKFPNKTVFCLPGPPRELHPMVDEYLVPYFKKKSNATIASKMVKLIGIGEGSAAEIIDDILRGSVNPTVAPYAKTNEVHLRITAKAENKEKADALIEPVFKEIDNRLGKFIYSTDEDETLEDVVIKKAKEKNLKITTCESCTGGLLSGTLVNVSGASDCFDYGFVTYANEAKENLVGVSKEILEKHGAVSEECAISMAKGALEKASADIAVSTTGIAGPTGGTKEKPVGLVYIGVATKDNAFAKRYVFNGNRKKVRDVAVVTALRMLLKEINGI